MSKVFIVTGASKGLGAAITRYLLAQSHKVVLAARSKEPLEEFKNAHPGQVEYLAADMAAADVPEKLAGLAVKSFGKIDGVVLNHSVLNPQKFAKTTAQSLRELYDVNVFSCIALAQAALDELRKTQGCVVWISSGAALHAYAGWSAYGSSKAVINSMAAHLAIEEPTVTSIALGPGRVDTDMQKLIRSSGEVMDKAAHDDFIQVFEQGKLLRPEQPGNVIARFVAKPQKDLSGKYFSWNSAEMTAYQE